MNSYGLTLADGVSWELAVADPELRPWLDQFARILRLSAFDSPTGRRLVVRKAEKLAWTTSHGDMVCEFPGARLREPEFGVLMMQECLGRITDETVLSGALPFHAALLERHDCGILIAAAGGTGKSTCARRAPAPWRAWSDDAALVVRGNQAHPFPTWMDHIWRGQNTTWPVQDHVALSAIFFLEQSSRDAATPLGQGEAVVRILQSARQSLGYFWDRMPAEQKRRLHMASLQNATTMSKTLPSFRLQATLHGRFWEHIEHALDKIP